MSSVPYYLPPELWEKILSEVTYLWGEFDIHEWIRSGSDLDLTWQDIVSDNKTNHFILFHWPKFKAQSMLWQKLVLVCKQWYNLAICYLYSFLAIQGTNIHQVMHTITNKQSLGPLVKRLEVKNGHEEGPQSMYNSYVYTNKLIECCPNLVIFHQSLDLDLYFLIAMNLDHPNLMSTLSLNCPQIQHIMNN